MGHCTTKEIKRIVHSPTADFIYFNVLVWYVSLRSFLFKRDQNIKTKLETNPLFRQILQTKIHLEITQKNAKLPLSWLEVSNQSNALEQTQEQREVPLL